MNQDDLDTLDDRIAVEVMGWHRGTVNRTADVWMDSADIVQAFVDTWWPTRGVDYAVWLVVEKLKRTYGAYIGVSDFPDGVRCDIWTEPRDDFKVIDGPYKTVPEAICRAALRFVHRHDEPASP